MSDDDPLPDCFRPYFDYYGHGTGNMDMKRRSVWFAVDMDDNWPRSTGYVPAQLYRLIPAVIRTDYDRYVDYDTPEAAMTDLRAAWAAAPEDLKCVVRLTAARSAVTI